MKRVIILISFLILLAFIPTVEAYDDSLKVIVLVPQDEIGAGDELVITAHIFDKAEYLDPTSIEGSMTTFNYEDDNFNEDSKPIELIKDQNGIWTASVILTEEDVNADNIMFEVTAQEQNNEDFGYSSLYLGGSFFMYEVSIRASDPSKLVAPQPGDTLNFEISIKRSDDYVDPEELTAKMAITETMEDSYGTEEGYPNAEVLPLTKVSTGNYTTYYKIPNSQDSRQFRVVVETEEGEAYSVVDMDSMFSIDYYQVWFHDIKTTSTSSSFELYVADKLGKIVENAEVDLEYRYMQFDDSGWMGGGYSEPEEIVKSTGLKNTDNEGKVRYDITYPDDAGYVDGSGNVKFGDHTQHFFGPIYMGDMFEEEYYEEEENYGTRQIPPPGEDEGPYGYGFEVICEESGEEYQFGENVIRHYTAYYTKDSGPIGFENPQQTEPYSNGIIYYYIHSEEEILDYGQVETDEQGNFELHLSLPTIEDGAGSDYMYKFYEINFEAPTHEAGLTEQGSTNDGMIYDEAFDFIDVSNEEYDDDFDYMDMFKNDIDINIDHLYVGGLSEVQVDYPKTGDNIRAYSTWMPFGFSMEMIESPPEDLMNWYPWTSDVLGMKLLVLNGSTYEATLCVPEFMPIDTDYTILVQIFDLETMSDQNYYPEPEVNFIIITPEAAPGSLAERREDSTPQPEGGYSLEWWVLVFFIVIILIIIGVLVARKRRRRKTITPEVVPAPQPPHPQQPQQVNYQPRQISKAFECPQCKTQFVLQGIQGQTVPMKCPKCNVQGQVKI